MGLKHPPDTKENLVSRIFYWTKIVQENPHYREAERILKDLQKRLKAVKAGIPPIQDQVRRVKTDFDDFFAS